MTVVINKRRIYPVGQNMTGNIDVHIPVRIEEIGVAVFSQWRKHHLIIKVVTVNNRVGIAEIGRVELLNINAAVKKLFPVKVVG